MVSIVIVSFNAEVDLIGCLLSLKKAPPAIDHEIIVVDNASGDGGVEAARAFAGVKVLEMQQNSGFAAATNAGIRESSGNLLLFLNSDTLVPAGAIDGLVARLKAVGAAAIAGPRLVDAQGQPELSFGRMISPLNDLRQKRLVRGHARREPAISRRVEDMTRHEQWPDWVSGACLLVRRGDAEAVGLLDERFFMYMEDVDFCAAIRARGGRILFTPAIEIVHIRGRSASTAPAATRAAYRRSQLAFYQKHHPGLAPLLRLYVRFFGRR
jgi:N-acetylglucosaminyl-diphospho-decaprenol L-rhamnosyltransferase